MNNWGNSFNRINHLFPSLSNLIPGRKFYYLNFYEVFLPNIEGARFNYLNNADIWNAWLQKARLVSSKMTHVRFSGSYMQGATLSFVKFKNVDLSGVNLNGADLSFAELTDVDFGYSDLRGCDFTYTKFCKVTLQGSLIDEHTKFKGCNWWTADFYSVFSTENNKMVDTRLLQNLFEHYGNDLVPVPEDIHPSVRFFMKQIEKKEIAQDNPN
jgi:uncharacterized protein YjbI with pentapeptide repeats